MGATENLKPESSAVSEGRERNFSLYLRQVLLVWAMELVLARWTSDRQSLPDALLSMVGLLTAGGLPFLISGRFRGLLGRIFFALALAAPVVVVCVGILVVPAMTARPIFGVVASAAAFLAIVGVYLGLAWKQRPFSSWLAAGFVAVSVFLAWWLSAGRLAPLGIWLPLVLVWAFFACCAMNPRRSVLLLLAFAAALVPDRGVTVQWSSQLAEASEESPDIILLCLDTLRADVAPEMAVYQKLREQGVEFQNMQAAGPWTLPSMATLMTSLPPWSHGAGTGEDWVPRGMSSETPTLAEFAQQAGYDTAALVHNPVLAPSMGFDRGFQIWDSGSVRTTWSLPRTRKALEARPFVAHLLSTANIIGRRSFQSAEQLASRAQSVIAERRERPLLLWVHMLDCHFPFRNAHQLDLPRHRRMQLERGDSDRFRADSWWQSEQGRATLVSAYHHEIEAADEALMSILDALGPVPERGRVVIFFSDHGEEFFEHGDIEHGQSFYQELLGVPLVIAGLPGTEPGKVVSEVVGHLDLATTLMGLVGGEGEDPWQGRNLAQPLQPRPLYSENLLHSVEPWDSQWAVRAGSWKYIFGPNDSLQAFDLASDPTEMIDLSELRRSQAAALPVRPERIPRAVSEIGGNLERGLDALGYTDGDRKD